MSTYTSEPGTRLGGRYRLEDRLAAAGGWSAWKAIDEILARPVSVVTFAAGFPRLTQVVTAARAASRLTDTRLTQVFDVEDSWDHPYIVLEWPVGDTLADMLADGPMDPVAGARIVAEAAAALSAAHAAGLAHLCLQPESVRWTLGGGVKVTGLGIDAALAGFAADDPELADTRGLGQLLYAALTGLWPGPDYGGLPTAPTFDGQPRRPRQVLAGVPGAIDEVAARALALAGSDGEPDFVSPVQVANALAAALPPVPVPPAVAARSQRQRGFGSQRTQAIARGGWGPRSEADRNPWTSRAHDSSFDQAGTDTDAEFDRGFGYSRATGRRSPGKLASIVLVALVAIVGVSAAAVHMLTRQTPTHHAGSRPSSSSSSPAAAATTITPVSANGFDALNPSDTGNENTNQAANVLNGNTQGWSTQQYRTADFGNLKKGTGLILDLGKPVKLTSVTVTFGTAPGADVELRLGSSDVRSAANLASMPTVAQGTNVKNKYTFTVHSTATGQYLVIWFTQLPQAASGQNPFVGQIFNVEVNGTG
jgi:hypothetical protein